MKHTIADFTKILSHCRSVDEIENVKHAYNILVDDYNHIEQRVISSRIQAKLKTLKNTP